MENSLSNSSSALFIDYENIYYFLKKRLEDGKDPNDSTIQILRDLRQNLAERWNADSVLMHAYADFERIEENAMGPLYLLGVTPHYVLGSDHKNAADMHLAIDALTVFYTRPEIQTFVVVAGDRDYIPLLKHLQQFNKRVLVASFIDQMSGDLLQIVGKEKFLDLLQFLPAGVNLKPPVVNREPVVIPKPPETMEQAMKVPLAELQFRRATKIEDAGARRALEIALVHFRDKPEIWVSPFLNKLRNEMQMLAEYERKALISELEDAGAFRVEKRRGEPNDYSVILVNWNHPDVQDLYPSE